MKYKIINSLVALLIANTTVAQPLEILKLRLKPDSLMLQAQTTGCTRKEHFSFTLDQTNTLMIKRTTPDFCRMRPRQIEFEYKLNEIGLDTETIFWIGEQTFSNNQ